MVFSVLLFTFRYIVIKEAKPPKEEVSGEVTEEKTEDAQPPPNKKKFKGQNKGRPRTVPKVASEFRICPTVHRNETCGFGDSCKFLHNIEEYLKNKPPDLGKECVNFKVSGKCRYGVECRFASHHLNEKFENVIDKEKMEMTKEASSNVLSKDLMNVLRKKKYKYERTEKYLKKMNIVDSRPDGVVDDVAVKTCGPMTDEDTCKLRSCEKKKVGSLGYCPSFNHLASMKNCRNFWDYHFFKF